jgi:hypothetical protein
VEDEAKPPLMEVSFIMVKWETVHLSSLKENDEMTRFSMYCCSLNVFTSLSYASFKMIEKNCGRRDIKVKLSKNKCVYLRTEYKSMDSF